MAKEDPQNKSDSPSRDKRGGEGFPRREPRSGARRHHDRVLTPAEIRAREERQAKEAKERHSTQEKARGDRSPKGWAGRRRER